MIAKLLGFGLLGHVSSSLALSKTLDLNIGKDLRGSEKSCCVCVCTVYIQNLKQAFGVTAATAVIQWTWVPGDNDEPGVLITSSTV
jgi:hypothetical protein